MDSIGMKPKTAAPTFFTERTLATYLAVSDRTIRDWIDWIRRGELPSYTARSSKADRRRRCRCLPRSAKGGSMRRHEAPTKRRNSSGEIVWMARYTGRDGKRYIAKSRWNGGKGTFALKREAQQAIDEAYGLSDRPDTLGEYFATWPTPPPAIGTDQRDQRAPHQPRLRG
jgi:hypothetical protein